MSNFITKLILEQKFYNFFPKKKFNFSKKQLNQDKKKNFKYLIMYKKKLIPVNKQLINLKTKYRSFTNSDKHFKLNTTDLSNITKNENNSLNLPKNQKNFFLNNNNINNTINNNISYNFYKKENIKSYTNFPHLNKKKNISLNFHFNENLFFSPSKNEKNSNVFYNTSMKIMKCNINNSNNKINSNKFKTLNKKEKNLISFTKINNNFNNDNEHMKTLSMRDLIKKNDKIKLNMNNFNNNNNNNKMQNNNLKIPLQNLFIKDKIKKFYVNSETQTEENNLLFTPKYLNSDGHRNIIVKIRKISSIKKN